MDLSFFRIKRLRAMLRLLPALAWLAVQLSMTAMPVAAAQQSQDPAVAALFETLGVDRVVLCTPDGKQVFEKHDDHAAHEDCSWCQAFSVTVVPEAPDRLSAVEFAVAGAWILDHRSSVSSLRHRACHPGRAPPVLI